MEFILEKVTYNELGLILRASLVSNKGLAAGLLS
ncbi:hypothetical protein MOVI109754_05700 [Moritella viscosa]